MAIADHMLSSNIGRTIRSSRQAVLDARLAINWLQGRGYKKIGVLGASLGTSIAIILSAHDERINIGSLLFIASHFGEVVWTGQATKHIRKGIEKSITLEELNRVWSIISPITYVDKLKGRPVCHLIISGVHDKVFLPYLTGRIIEKYREEKIRHIWKMLSCGHYTVRIFPFNLIAVFLITNFFKRFL